jgi:C-terminal processing protease CtpA/Prc
MKKLLPLLAALTLLLSACVRPVQTPAQLPALAVTPLADQPYQVTGTFKVSNGFVVGTYFVEHAVALTDMHGFVIRDEEWELPVDSQVLGYAEVDLESLTGRYDLNLPVQPEGEFNDVDNNGKSDKGVQIFAVAYSPNLAGGPFSSGDDRSRGWPSYLASVITDPENDDEVTGGKLIVWAPDDAQSFPTGFGADGLLFTDDDPAARIPSGYSFVNLSADPFEVTREASANFTLFEPQDVVIKDFSNLSYTDAFDRMFEIVRREYAFNGIEGKAPNWDALHAGIRPRVEQAQKDRDPQAYYLALRDFTWAFRDGHVSLGGGEIQAALFSKATEGGYGFAIRELDNGRVIVSYVTARGSAAGAGIQVGAQVTEFNGLPISAAIDAAESWASPQSMASSVRYQKARYLTRAPLGTTATVTFTNPGGKPQTVTLTAYAERESFASTSLFLGYNANGLPVEYKILSSGAGYVKISSNYDDLNLIVRLFERALKTFEAAEVKGIIIDMRQNSGGAPLGLAGFLTENEIPLGQLQYFSEATGRFENEGQPDKILPNENQYRFDKMVLLVGPACASACELEAYGFSRVPGMIVVGQFPSSGTEAEVARGQFILPDGFSLQIPTGRFVLPDGGLFLEGQGVPLTVRVPIDESTVLSAEDVVLNAAVAIVTGE